MGRVHLSWPILVRKLLKSLDRSDAFGPRAFPFQWNRLGAVQSEPANSFFCTGRALAIQSYCRILARGAAAGDPEVQFCLCIMILAGHVGSERIASEDLAQMQGVAMVLSEVREATAPACRAQGAAISE